MLSDLYHLLPRPQGGPGPLLVRLGIPRIEPYSVGEDASVGVAHGSHRFGTAQIVIGSLLFGQDQRVGPVGEDNVGGASSQILHPLLAVRQDVEEIVVFGSLDAHEGVDVVLHRLHHVVVAVSVTQLLLSPLQNLPLTVHQTSDDVDVEGFLGAQGDLFQVESLVVLSSLRVHVLYGHVLSYGIPHQGGGVREHVTFDTPGRGGLGSGSHGILREDPGAVGELFDGPIPLHQRTDDGGVEGLSVGHHVEHDHVAQP